MPLNKETRNQSKKWKRILVRLRHVLRKYQIIYSLSLSLFLCPLSPSFYVLSLSLSLSLLSLLFFSLSLSFFLSLSPSFSHPLSLKRSAGQVIVISIWWLCSIELWGFDVCQRKIERSKRLSVDLGDKRTSTWLSKPTIKFVTSSNQ